MSESGRPKSIQKLRFAEAMRRLDELVAALESDEIDLEDQIDRYEEAMKLIGHCQKTLESAEQRIRKIQADAAGNISAEEFTPPPDAEGAESED